MAFSVHKVMKLGHTDYMTEDRKAWVMKHPGQVIATISQIMWCVATESSINEMSENPFALKDWYDGNVGQLT